MNIVFRADASIELGIGHVMRCLALAGELQRRGMQTHFICRELPHALYEKMIAQGHEVTVLSATTDFHWQDDAQQTSTTIQQADWLVVDHYSLDVHWEAALRPYTRRILAIDDLANRTHDCDLLLDQNLHPNNAYINLVPAQAVILIGPRYALLRPQFAIQRQEFTRQYQYVERILICFGGSDPAGATLKVLTALAQVNCVNSAIDVVIGGMNPHRSAIQSACHTLSQRVQCHYDVDDMAGLMAQADLIIAAGGSSSWERCCLGVPSLVIAIADNQLANAMQLAQQGAHVFLGELQHLSLIDMQAAICEIVHCPTCLSRLSQQARVLVDGYGTHYVANYMMNFIQ